MKWTCKSNLSAFVPFLGPSGIAFSPVTCAHLWPRTPLAKPLMHKNLAFLFECLFYDPLANPLKWIFMILHENASCPRRGALFCSFALSRRGLEFTPKCISGALFVDLAGLFPSNNIAPRCSQKHNFNFWAKTDETNPIQFSFFSRPWKSVCIFFWFFHHFSKKRFLPRCGAHFWKACARTQLPNRLSSGSD